MAGPWRATDSDAPTALGNVRILDLSGIGAFTSMLLADFGADVIRTPAVESSLRHQSTAQGGQFDPERRLNRERASRFNPMHRGQRSIALDLKSEAGREIFYALAREADVALESMRPGVTTRLGADYATLSALNPRLIYCSLTGYGQTGPLRDVPGHDINYIAQAGLLALTRRPGSPPVMPLNFGADFAGGGLFLALSIMIALWSRERSGRGQYIDMSMTDGVLALLAPMFSGYFSQGDPIRPGEFLLNGGAPFYEVYPCRDGKWISIGCLEPHFYQALCEALELDEFVDRQLDTASYPELRARIAEKFALDTREFWLERLTANDAAAAPVLEMEEIPDDPQLRERGMIAELDSSAGTVRQIGIGPKLSETPGRIGGQSPLPGEHCDEILTALGYDAEAIRKLRDQGAVA